MQVVWKLRLKRYVWLLNESKNIFFCRQKPLNTIRATYEWPLEFQRRRASPHLLAALFVTLIAAILAGLDARAAKLRSDCKAWSQVSFWTPSPPPPMWAESKSTMCEHYEFWKSRVPSENCSYREDKVKVTVVTDPLCLLSPTNTNSSLSISSKSSSTSPPQQQKWSLPQAAKQAKQILVRQVNVPSCAWHIEVKSFVQILC